MHGEIMRRFLGLLILVMGLIPLTGCGEGSAAPPPQAKVQPPQPRVLKPDVRSPVVSTPAPAPAPTPAPAPAPAAETKSEATPPAAPVTQIVEKKELGERVFRIPAGDTGPRAVQYQIRTTAREAAGREAREGDVGDSPVELPVEKPSFERKREYKTPPMPAGVPGWFGERDKDKDGQVGMYEWPRDQLEEFAKHDRNGDGFITAIELIKPANGAIAAAPPSETKPAPAIGSAPANDASAAVASAATPLMINVDGSASAFRIQNPSANGGDDDRNRRMSEDIIRRYDRNADNKLDPQELERTMTLRNNWQQHDTNKDGMLDLDEITAYMKSRPGFGPPGGGGPGSGPAGGGAQLWMRQGERGGNRDREAGMFDRFDQNKDGKVTEGELPPFFRTRFSEWDANKDGQLDAQELSAGMESGMRRMRERGPDR